MQTRSYGRFDLVGFIWLYILMCSIIIDAQQFVTFLYHHPSVHIALDDVYLKQLRSDNDDVDDGIRKTPAARSDVVSSVLGRRRIVFRVFVTKKHTNHVLTYILYLIPLLHTIIHD